MSSATQRLIAHANLAEALQDELFSLRERLGGDAFPKPAVDNLNDWAGNDKGWRTLDNEGREVSKQAKLPRVIFVR